MIDVDQENVCFEVLNITGSLGGNYVIMMRSQGESKKKQKPRELRKTITNPVGAMSFCLLKWKCMLLLPQKAIELTLSDEKVQVRPHCGNAIEVFFWPRGKCIHKCRK